MNARKIQFQQWGYEILLIFWIAPILPLSTFFSSLISLHGVLGPKISVRVQVCWIQGKNWRRCIHCNHKMFSIKQHTLCMNIEHLYTLCTAQDLATMTIKSESLCNILFLHSAFLYCALVHSLSCLYSYKVTGTLVCRHFCSCLKSFIFGFP